MKRKILIVDDEQDNLKSLERIFELEDYRCFLAENAKTALNLLSSTWIHIAFIDIRMPGEDGVSLLKKIKQKFPEIEVIMMTAYGTIETAVEAMKLGAYDFITKPLNRHLILKTSQKAFEKQELTLENKVLKTKLKNIETTQKMIGNSDQIRKIIRTAHQTAPSDSSILIEGESGTGKEVLADLIFNLSHRNKKPFIKVNCAALADNLLESELFGHEKGSFTGAHKQKKGLFEEAHGGTLFLDEISELSASTQAKLLRIIQSGEFTRLGSTKVLQCNVRLMSATNQNLEKLVKKKKFREDLFYRLNVIQFCLPPLRKRKEDISALIEHLIALHNKKMNKKVSGITKSALEKLLAYNWPGNIRELHNVLERAVLLSHVEILSIDSFNLKANTTQSDSSTLSFSIDTPLDEVKKHMIEKALEVSHGDKKAAARLLGINQRTIYRILKNSR